jgi:hypothetical protein
MASLMTRVRALPLGPERTDTLVGGVTDLLMAGRDVMLIVAQQPALRQDIHQALGSDRLISAMIEGLFGPELSPPATSASPSTPAEP